MARTKQRASAPLYGTPGNVRPPNADRITATLEEVFWKPANVPKNKAAEPVAQTAGDGNKPVTHGPEETGSIAGRADVSANSVVADMQNMTSAAVSVPDLAKGSTDKSALSSKKNDMSKAACVAMNNERGSTATATAAVDVDDFIKSDKENGTTEVVTAAPLEAAKHIKREESEDVKPLTTADNHEGALPDTENASFKSPARETISAPRKKSTPRKKLTIKFPTAMYFECSPASTVKTNNTSVNSSAIKVATPLTSPISPRYWVAPPNSPIKRSAGEAAFDDSDFSDFDKALANVPRSTPVFKLAPAPKKKKAKTMITAKAEDDDRVHHFSDINGDVEMSGEASNDHVADDNASNDSTDDDEADPGHYLVQAKLKRKARLVDPTDAEDAELIRNAAKAGPEYYNDDPAEDLLGDVKGAGNPELYRNVNWGTAATSFDNFEETDPFLDFVPGRWERHPDGTVRDQKFKLVVKLVDHQGRQKIFRNPPPKDWSNQTALTALNKRSVQQWRRNTKYRFRQKVVPYCDEERAWITDKLNADGKPHNGWKAFVTAFNEAFDGKMIHGHDKPRPHRSQSSLTKDIDRFSAQYKAGKIPVAVRNQDKRAAGQTKLESKTSA